MVNRISRAANIANDATDAAKRAAQTTHNLGKSAKAIGKVVDMIKGIASQTNLRALNVTIEAASAGDAGKGFAVANVASGGCNHGNAHLHQEARIKYRKLAVK